MRKRPQISRQEAQARSHKAWQTRYRKYGRPAAKVAIVGTAGYIAYRNRAAIGNYLDNRYNRQVKNPVADVYKVGLGLVLANSGAHKVKDKIRFRVNPDRVWIRPNGEHVKLRGFNEDDMKYITPALQTVDQHTKRSAKSNLKSISKQSNIPVFGAGAAGLHLASSKDVAMMQRFHNPDKHYDSKGTPLQRKLVKVMGGDPEKTVIRMHPNRGIVPKRSIPLMRQPGAPRSPSWRRNPEEIMTHELGHAFGNMLIYNPKTEKEFNKAFDWKVREDVVLGERYRTHVASKHYNRTGYQRSIPEEDMAESFRAALGQTSWTHPKKGPMKLKDEKGFYRVELTPGRQKFLNNHLLRTQPDKLINTKIKVVAK